MHILLALLSLLSLDFVYCVGYIDTHKSVSSQTSSSRDVDPSHFHLSAVSADEYTTISHAAFSGYGVRVRLAKDFCDPTVKAYTGYLDVDHGAKHLFFYFFESRSDPHKDDLMMWINGGPGSSSALGLFMELGPCLVDPDHKSNNGTVFNPYGWNDKANIFFLDQPVGVGFSYADNGRTVESTEDAAKDVAAFMYIFCDAFSQFKGRSFHMAGESYGGRYIPLFAAEIVDQNRRAAVGGFTPINLKSIVIGNGLTDFETAMLSFYDMTCTNAAVQPVLDISTCVRMRRALPRCQRMMQADCITRFDELGCTAAVGFCENELVNPFIQAGRNPYDISKPCDHPDSGQCYPLNRKIVEYLNRPDIRLLIGVDPVVANFTISSDSVNLAFRLHMDQYHPTQYYISALLERSVDVLIYAGVHDLVCNWVGNFRWMEGLEWTGQIGYQKAELREWIVGGHQAGGMTKSWKGLTFATLQGAGHMVPYDRPVEALLMVNRWIESRQL